MRILTVGGKMLTQALRAHGHEVRSLGFPGFLDHPQDSETNFLRAPGEARLALAGIAASFAPDWIIQVDDSSPLPHLGLENIPIPKAWYALDSHLHWEWHRHYAPLFDVVFCAQKNRVGDLGAFRTGVEWLPLCFTGEPAFLPWNGRRHDVAFVGTLNPAINPDRIAFLDRLKSMGLPVHAVQGPCDPVYRDARVVFNQSADDDLNFRFFEAMGNGALLITDRLSHSLGDFGEPGKDFLVYEKGDAGDLRAQVEWALSHPTEAEAMARRGQARIANTHLIGHRVARITEALAHPVPGPAARGPLLAHLAGAHEHLSRLELPGPLVDFFAAEGRRLALTALENSPSEPYARLALAQLDLEKGEHAQALAWLEGADGDGVPEYRRRYLFLRCLLIAHLGRLDQARILIGGGLREFPGDADLARLGRVLGA
ncbi:MAG: glycosyltransferase [Fibrobacteria bacterium]